MGDIHIIQFIHLLITVFIVRQPTSANILPDNTERIPNKMGTLVEDQVRDNHGCSSPIFIVHLD